MTVSVESVEVQRVLERLEGVRRQGDGYIARCSGHDDHNASLSVSRGQDGRVLLHCHAGCVTEAVVAGMGLKFRDLMPRSIEREKAHQPAARRIVAKYDYCDAAGKLCYQVIRYEPKGFKQRRPDGSGHWVWGLTAGWYETKGSDWVRCQLEPGEAHDPERSPKPGAKWFPECPRVLYRLQETLDAIKERQGVFIPEGERDCATLAAAGVAACCNSGGAGNWQESCSEALAKAHVVLLPDNDAAGWKHVLAAAHTLHKYAATVRILQLPGLPPKGDVTDWFAAGGTKAELMRLAKACPVWSPSDDTGSPTLPTDEREQSSSSEALAMDTEGPPTNYDEWPAPIPLTGPRMPGFPAEALPEVLRAWVRAEATALQVPVDLPATLSLGACATAVAGRHVVRVKPDWEEPLNLYLVNVAPPAERKSAVFADAYRPIEDFEAELQRVAGPEIAAKRAQREADEQQLSHLKKKATSGNDDDRKAMEQLARELAEATIASAPRLLADDATPERLVGLLVEQGGRLGMASAEGGGLFDIAGGRYSNSNAPNFDVLLKAHAGDTIRVDRMGRTAEFIRRPALTINLATQPEVIRGLSDRPGFRGRGLLARFLYSTPRSLVGRRAVDPPPVPTAIRDGYAELVKGLLHSSWCEPVENEASPRVLRLDGKANELLFTFMTQLEPRLGEGGDLAAIADWAGKLSGAVVRIAGILHLVEHAEKPRPWTAPITAAGMERAIRIGEYFLAHALAAFDLMGLDPTLAGARHVLPWLRRRQEAIFTKHELHQSHRSRFKRSADLVPVLELLIDYAIVRRKETPRGSVGRPPECFEINPGIHRDAPEDSVVRSQFTQKAQNSGQDGGFEPFESFELSERPNAEPAPVEWEVRI